MLPSESLAKLAEECGQLLQIVGEHIAYGSSDALNKYLEDELADVTSMIAMVVDLCKLDGTRVQLKAAEQLVTMRKSRVSDGLI